MPRPNGVAPGAAAGIEATIPAQPLQGLVVGDPAPTLPDDLAVPGKSEALQAAQNLVCGTGHRARRIEILDAYQPASAALASQTVTCDSRDQ